MFYPLLDSIFREANAPHGSAFKANFVIAIKSIIIVNKSNYRNT